MEGPVAGRQVEPPYGRTRAIPSPNDKSIMYTARRERTGDIFVGHYGY
jgi:hypothetical protein